MKVFHKHIDGDNLTDEINDDETLLAHSDAHLLVQDSTSMEIKVTFGK